MKLPKIPVFKLAVLVEGALFIFSLVWIWIRKLPTLHHIKPSLGALFVGIMVGSFVLFSNFIFYFLDAFLFGGKFKRIMEKEIYPIFARVSLLEIIGIALFSGVCEELFFRGVLMTEFGVLISSIAFGGMHTLGRGTAFLGVWSSFIGMYFAIVYKATGNLFIPMVAHTFNNFMAVSYIRYFYFEQDSIEKRDEDALESIKEDIQYIVKEKTKNISKSVKRITEEVFEPPVEVSKDKPKNVAKSPIDAVIPEPDYEDMIEEEKRVKEILNSMPYVGEDGGSSVTSKKADDTDEEGIGIIDTPQ